MFQTGKERTTDVSCKSKSEPLLWIRHGPGVSICMGFRSRAASINISNDDFGGKLLGTALVTVLAKETLSLLQCSSLLYLGVGLQPF